MVFKFLCAVGVVLDDFRIINISELWGPITQKLGAHMHVKFICKKGVLNTVFCSIGIFDIEKMCQEKG